MKTYKYILAFFVSIVLLFSACSKDSLDLQDPNNPVPANLKSEEGLKKFALGFYYHLMGNYWWWWSGADLNAMGDIVSISAGNWSWRWVNQTSSIHLSNGTVLTPTDPGAQPDILRSKNDRTQGDDNTFTHEWQPMYLVLGQANYLLEVVDNGDVSNDFKNTLKAWAYFWKGLVYSRIGALYDKAIINDEYAKTNNNYVSYTAILDEAAANFNKAIAILNSIPAGNVDYEALLKYAIPSSCQGGSGGIPTPEEWIRTMNTFMARNILVNKYASDLTAADLAQIKAFADKGLRQGDVQFVVRHGTNTSYSLLLSTPCWTPARALMGWERVSERWVQDFKTGDKRLDRNMRLMPSTSWSINPQGRGYQYGTRWSPIAAETNGGEYFSQQSLQVEVALCVTFEENALMLAECAIRSGNIETGLGYIDLVRLHQNAGLAPVVGTGLNLSQALEELRRERRVGLYKNYVAFYDARRWGLLKPLSAGGGRTGAVVVVGQNSYGFPGGVDFNATIEYNYLERFDVPATELDFNPASGIGGISGKYVNANVK